VAPAQDSANDLYCHTCDSQNYCCDSQNYCRPRAGGDPISGKWDSRLRGNDGGMDTPRQSQMTPLPVGS
jgi:hypothetical protein